MRPQPTCSIAGRPEPVWELLTSGAGSARWLGTDGTRRLEAGVKIEIGGRQGRVVEVRMSDRELVLAWPGPDDRLRVALAPGAADEADHHHVTLGVTGPIGDERAHSEWDVALAGARLAVSEARQQRDPRQAVILIHGIGEQLPGTTVRGFATGVLGRPPGPDEGALLMKPDHRLEPRYELVRLQAFKDAIPDLPRTDFFELYWQDLIRDTKLPQVIRWARSTAKAELPPKLRGLRRLILVTIGFLALAAAVVGVVLLFGLAQVHLPSWVRKGSAWITAASLLGSLVSGSATGWAVTGLGDAARYLQPLPDNVEVRGAIRKRGVTLLRSLHDSGQYQRIVLVGHSLGSVIALDVLTEYWWEVYWRHGNPSRLDLDAYIGALQELDRAAATVREAEGDEAIARYQQAQGTLWEAMRGVGTPWLVTDLVTLGSPLQYPWPFLASTSKDFEARKAEMTVPEAPPRPEPPREGQPGGTTFPAAFVGPDGTGSIPLLHQAAVFGPTRWTNIAFPCHWWVFGDAVGGPLLQRFGRGVRDRMPEPSGTWRGRHSPKLHSQYWVERQPDALSMLRRALGLSCYTSLRRLVEGFPLSEFLKATPSLVSPLGSAVSTQPGEDE